MKLSRFVVALLLGSSAASAYEVDTHAWIMQQGYLRSNLPSAALRERLGFERLDEDTPFRVYEELATLGDPDAYLDLAPGASFGIIGDPYSAPPKVSSSASTHARRADPTRSSTGLASAARGLVQQQQVGEFLRCAAAMSYP